MNDTTVEKSNLYSALGSYGQRFPGSKQGEATGAEDILYVNDCGLDAGEGVVS